MVQDKRNWIRQPLGYCSELNTKKKRVDFRDENIEKRPKEIDDGEAQDVSSEAPPALMFVIHFILMIWEETNTFCDIES